MKLCGTVVPLWQFIRYISSYISKVVQMVLNLSQILLRKHLKWKYFQTKCFRNMTQNTYSTLASHEKKINVPDFVPFNETIKLRQAESKRSILVQVQSSSSYKELYTYCEHFGVVKNMLHYSTGVEPMNFIVVEFEDEKSVNNLLSASSHLENVQVVPVNSQFLWFRAANKRTLKSNHNKVNISLLVENGTKEYRDEEIREQLRKCNSVSDQIYYLYQKTKLNDVSIRLRYLSARQIERALSGLFPHAIVYPFGSSVNGYGKMGCDLDLVLRLNDFSNTDGRLVFHCKASTGSERSISQRHMETIGDLIQLFLPGCSQVRRILQARVPIIKYYQQLTDFECDLSMSNMSGVYMSDFLHIMGSVDERVRPLVFTIRKWASEVGLTNSSPGRWISNFSLTLLVLAFLQNPEITKPVLPSLNSLVKQAGPGDKYITEDGINCSFLRNATEIKEKFNNTDSINDLLVKFFEYYSNFDFTSKAVCLNEGSPIIKPEHSPLYIINPLERGLNASKNVSLEELEKFKMEVRNAVWTLESQETKTSNWGILKLFEGKRKNNYNHFYLPNKTKLLEVSKLFEDESTMKFKNDNVKKEIEQIRKETSQKISELENNCEHNVNRQKSKR